MEKREIEIEIEIGVGVGVGIGIGIGIGIEGKRPPDLFPGGGDFDNKRSQW
jgi:hypothetical protein